MLRFLDNRTSHPASVLSLTVLGLFGLACFAMETRDRGESPIESMLAWPPFVHGGLVIVAALVAAAHLHRVYWLFGLARYIAGTPAAQTRSAAQGINNISGTAEMLGETTAVSPITHTTCLWYAADRIEETGATRHRISSVIFHLVYPLLARYLLSSCKTSTTGFLLRHDTGDVTIDPVGAMVVTCRVDVGYGHFEHRIHAGDPITVYGEFCTEHPADRSCVIAERRRLIDALKADRQQLLRRFDRNGDALIDPAEWDAVCEALGAEARENAAGVHARPAAHLLRRPISGAPYVISTLPEAALLFRLHGWSVLNWAGFGIAIGLVVLFIQA